MLGGRRSATISGLAGLLSLITVPAIAQVAQSTPDATPLPLIKTRSANQSQRGPRELPRCDKPLGTIAIVEPENRWWRELNLGSPEAILKVFVQQSGCFTLVNRGRAMQSRAMERAMAEHSEPRADSNIGGGQVRVADFLLQPDIVSSNNNSGGGIGGFVGGMLGGRVGAAMGGAINVKKKEANVVLSMIDTRSTEESVSEGYSRKSDIGFGASGGAGWWGGLAGAGSGGYQNTEIGQVIVLAYLDAYIATVALARETQERRDAYGSGVSDAPFLPWPPPSPSGLGDVSANFRRSNNLGEISVQIRARLLARGYEKLHHFSVPGGFGVTTDVERVGADGRPSADRWTITKVPSSGGLIQYITDLFVGNDGRFRLFAFVVTNEDPAPAGFKATQMDIDRWKSSGKPYLSARMSSLPARPGTRVWLMVYEFERDKSKNGRLVAPDQGGASFQQHKASLGLR